MLATRPGRHAGVGTGHTSSICLVGRHAGVATGHTSSIRLAGDLAGDNEPCVSYTHLLEGVVLEEGRAGLHANSIIYPGIVRGQEWTTAKQAVSEEGWK